MPFRTSAQLGPGLESKDAKFFWDFQPGIDVSPRLGNPELGNDGHVYILVQAAAALAANATFGVDETTWRTTTGSAFNVPAGAGAIAQDQYFWARRAAI